MGTVAQTFGGRLRVELVARNMGVRTLAKQLAADPTRVEAVRRRLNKYVHEGVTPGVAARHEIESALGLERDALKPDADEDEADPAMVEAFRVFTDLMQRLGAQKAEAQA
jgi:hypothetical protein